MKLTYVFQISKSILPTKNGINTTNILYTGSYKSFPILWRKMFITYFKEIKKFMINLTVEIKLLYEYMRYYFSSSHFICAFFSVRGRFIKKTDLYTYIYFRKHVTV